ncbi:hypothetical protein L873DRAFT_1678987 [Choiromyces venosus 120613-1]|uniref:Uncharacterized protein n=1 Tax=Choiromyces venosus 120613-1 TaxID=1336337 RepID=A0A3N4JUV7_9PEZI|nr:hypothetical protein L873DRAFT_1678987 [Choiromyces venosus 120613-1]
MSALPHGEFDESGYYGPYNGLLNDLFPKQEHYMVVPLYRRPTQLTSVDFTTIFLVQQQKHPVFFIKIKPAGHINNTAPRALTDKQMRERFEDLGDRVEIPILHGVSAIGTKFCFYKYTKATRALEPGRIPGSSRMVVDAASINRWNVDILTPQGEQRLREVVGNVKGMCTQMG